MSEVNLMEYAKSIYSQHGQDGILQKIFELIGTTNKYFVEFGSNGEKTGGGNTAYLREFGFSGLLMDGYENPYNEKHARDFPVEIEFVTAENINSLFEKHSVPNEFDLLSIDIDGQDFHVWNNLDDKYKPRVVIIESNYGMYPQLDVVQPYDIHWTWDGTYRHGASLRALMNLGNQKGYDLVAFTGADGIFIQKEILKKKQITCEFANNIEALWNYNFQQGNLPKEPSIQEIFSDSTFFQASSFFLSKRNG